MSATRRSNPDRASAVRSAVAKLRIIPYISKNSYGNVNKKTRGGGVGDTPASFGNCRAGLDFAEFAVDDVEAVGSLDNAATLEVKDGFFAGGAHLDDGVAAFSGFYGHGAGGAPGGGSDGDYGIAGRDTGDYAIFNRSDEFVRACPDNFLGGVGREVSGVAHLDYN